MFRRLVLASLTVLCLGWGGVAVSAQYQFSSTAGGQYMTRSPHCSDVAEMLADRWSKIGYDIASGTLGAGGLWWAAGGCSGPFQSAGDTRVVTLGYYAPSAGVTSTTNVNVTLVSVVEDAQADDVSSVSIQRVLVLSVAGLLFGLGLLWGK